MPLRNIPEHEPAQLASLIEARVGQVSSMALARDGGADITLLAFAPGESVSEEEYAGDTLYLLVEGRARLALPSGSVTMSAGDVLCVPAHTQHAVENVGCGFKVLQLTLH